MHHLCQHVMSVFVYASGAVTHVWQQHKASWLFAAAHMTYLEACIETRHIDSAAHCRLPPLTHQLLVLLHLLHMLKLITNSDRLSIWQSLLPHNTSDSSFITKPTAKGEAIFSMKFSDLYMQQLSQGKLQGCMLIKVHASCINSERFSQASIKLKAGRQTAYYSTNTTSTSTTTSTQTNIRAAQQPMKCAFPCSEQHDTAHLSLLGFLLSG